MKISGELRFNPDNCKWQYEDNCFDCIHFIGLHDNNSIECDYEDNEEDIVTGDDVQNEITLVCS